MFRRHTLALALALIAALALIHRPTERVLAAPPTISILALPVSTAGIESPISINSNTDDPVSIFRAALTRSSWPAHLHHDLEVIAACESRLDALQIGDGGRAFGWLQIRVDYHAELAARYELLDGPQNLEAGWAVYRAAGGSFWPWSCWRPA